MARSIALLCCLSTVTAACFPAPKPDGDVMVGTTGIEAVGSDDAPYTTGTVADGETTAATDATSGDATTTSSTSSIGDSSDGGSSGDSGEPGELPPGYPTDQPFGDDVRELDLVGRWTMPWEPAGQDHVEWVIADDGSFEWFERTAACELVGDGRGRLWVEGTQLAFAVDVWDKPTPWDTAAATGVEFAAPWRMRIGYTPMGGYLGLAAPRDLVAIAPWQGHGYSRLDATMGPTGAWAGESELWATPPDAALPVLVVRDRFDAQVPETATALLVHGRTWWWPDGPSEDAAEQVNAPWSDQTPGNLAGAATIAGVLHAYDALGLISFVADRSFKLGAAPPCP